MALPTLLYRYESWTLRKSQASRILAAEMRFLNEAEENREEEEAVKELEEEEDDDEEEEAAVKE